jgi:hypothetical protein
VVSKLWKRVFYQRIGRRNAINMLRNHIWLAPCKFDRRCCSFPGD